MPTDREERESRRIQSATRSRLLSRARRRTPSTPSASASDAPLLSDLTEDMSMAGDDDEPGAEEAKRTETETPVRGGDGHAGEDDEDGLTPHRFSSKVYLNEKSLVTMLSDNVRVNLKSGAKAVIELFQSKLRQTKSVAVSKYGTWEEYYSRWRISRWPGQPRAQTHGEAQQHPLHLRRGAAST